MSASYVYRGVWVNWSRGPIFGWTLSLTTTEAQMLAAFLAVFVTATGTQAWKIVSFILHQLRAAQIPGDGRHQQAQVILRNTGSALGASWEFLNLGWPWRKTASSAFPRVLLLALIAVLHATCWGLAGVFSSRVSQVPGDEVLVRSEDCGVYQSRKDISDSAEGFFFQSLNLNATFQASTYSRLCYTASSRREVCDQYTAPRLDWKTNANATCPFDPEFCIFNGTAAAFEMDTGVLDVHEFLGINTPLSERIGYRKVSTCAPMRVPHGFSRLVNNTEYPDSAVKQIFYVDVGGTSQGTSSATNYTYEYQILPLHGEYKISTVTSNVGESDQAWTPIRQLNRTDADVTLYFLEPEYTLFQQPVDDPFFAAHTPFPNSSVIYGYTSDYYVNLLGCIDQYQFCNLNPAVGQPSCTPLTGQTPISDAIQVNKVGFSSLQIAIATRLTIANVFSSIDNSVTSVVSLQAYNSLYGVSQGPLPNYQWQIEVASWFNVALAKLQAKVVEFATGPSYVAPDGVVTLYDDHHFAAQCYMQKIRSSTGYYSFSLVGVVIILVIGGLILFVSFYIDTFTGFVLRRIGKEYKAQQWILDEKLQLQRMTYEKANIGNWRDCDSKVPVTTTKIQHMGVISTGLDGRHLAYVAESEDNSVDMGSEGSHYEALKGRGFVGYAPVSLG